jgi:hypothetical protein
MGVTSPVVIFVKAKPASSHKKEYETFTGYLKLKKRIQLFTNVPSSSNIRGWYNRSI